MAAGRGNRMRPLSDLIPKALVPFKGNALIYNSIEQLYEVVDKIHITVGYKKVDLATHLLSSSSVDSIINTSGNIIEQKEFIMENIVDNPVEAAEIAEIGYAVQNDPLYEDIKNKFDFNQYIVMPEDFGEKLPATETAGATKGDIVLIPSLLPSESCKSA